MNKEQNNLTLEQELERHKRWLKDLHIRMDEMKKPPTAEEVCDALGKFYNIKVYYMNNNYHNGFHFKDSWFIVKYQNDRLRFSNDYMFHVNDLPPHLLTLIGRFYEGLENE